MENDPVMREYTQMAQSATTAGQSDLCDSDAHCSARPVLTYRPHDPRQIPVAYQAEEGSVHNKAPASMSNTQTNYIYHKCDGPNRK